MKKYNTSKLTIITALILTASLLLSGCSEGDVEVVGGGENNSETVTEVTVTEAAVTTPAVTVSAETAEPVTSAAETSAVATAAETEKATEKTTEAPATAPVAAWTETAASGTMYINTNGIYSRKEAVQGSTKVKQYRLNEAVTVTAKTDTNYYKLSDGTFIHADYLSSNKLTATTTTVAIKPVVTTSYAQQSNPTEQDRSYLNLSNSDVKYILNECQKYAKSLGYRVVTYNEYLAEMDALTQKALDLYKTTGITQDEAYEKVGWYEWYGSLYITDYNDKDFWSTGWHNIAFAGNFELVKGGDYDGYYLCKTKEESINWLIRYLKGYIKMDYSEGRSSGAIATPLKTFDKMAKEGSCIFPYDVLHSYYADYMVYDINTSYAFSVKLN